MVFPFSSEKEIPKMKVFTVGLDQKPPLDESKSPPSPPPGYATPSPPASVIMGPEHPIIIRKSRGYKGVLIVLLSVFLIALFALTLSEIAYNRQRDENFFRLRWAELKHRMGFDYNNQHRWQERVFNMHHGQELPQMPMMPPMAALEVQKPDPTTEAPVAEKVDDKQASVADRLQFFRKLLEGIKKQAENMGFDGTMQVSVVQVDPLSSSDSQENTKSDSFLDGFGEVHQPKQEIKSNSESSENDNFLKLRRPCGFFNCEDMNSNFHMPRLGMPFRPDMMRPSTFDRFGDKNEENTVDRFFPKVEMMEIPLNQEENGNMYGRKFGRILQDIIATRLRNLQQMNSFIPQRPENFPNAQNSFWQPMRPQFPQSFPIGNGLDFNQPPNQFNQQPHFPQQQQQQQTPPPFIFFPNPQPGHFPRHRLDNSQGPQQQNFVPPEDRIQVEPPAQNFVDWKPWNSENADNGFVNLNNEVNRGWTHQENNQPENHHQLPQVPEQQPQQQIPEQQPQQVPEQQPQAAEVAPPQPAPILDGTTSEKKDDEIVPEEQKQAPVLAIDPPASAVDFPAVKFPMMNDENNNNREHNPLFFQVDEPQQQEQPMEQ